jgi:hypothetical protein
MIGVLHCMAMTSGRVCVTGYEALDGGMLPKFTATCRTWHDVIAMIAITAPVRTLVSDFVLTDPDAQRFKTTNTLRAGEWAVRRQAWEARRVERFIREQQQEFDHWGRVDQNDDEGNP